MRYFTFDQYRSKFIKGNICERAYSRCVSGIFLYFDNIVLKVHLELIRNVISLRHKF